MTIPIEATLRVAATLAASCANGPGLRFVLWLQGCTARCPGCANAEFRDVTGGTVRSVASLFEEIIAGQDILSGVTISGGEPFEQEDSLLALTRRIRAETSLNLFIFSGWDASRLQDRYSALELAEFADAILCGPFRPERPPDYARFLPSDNQTFLFPTNRLTGTDFRDLIIAEQIIGPDGTIFRSGIERV